VANPQKEVWELIAAAKKQGWRVKETKKGYFLFDPSGRHKELLHKTPSDWRALRHSLSRMRRYGFKWKGR
jgi:hypothetical protein